MINDFRFLLLFGLNSIFENGCKGVLFRLVPGLVLVCKNTHSPLALMLILVGLSFMILC